MLLHEECRTTGRRFAGLAGGACYLLFGKFSWKKVDIFSSLEVKNIHIAETFLKQNSTQRERGKKLARRNPTVEKKDQD